MKHYSKNKFVYTCILFALLLIVASGPNVYGQSKWIEDRQMNFKINVPATFQTNQLWDGSDKIHAFVSPDQNLVVRVRAIPLKQSITDVQLQSIFENKIIQGAIRLNDEASDLNGLPARWSGYMWKYNNVNTVLVNYYIIRPEMAYVVWSITAENMVEQKTEEMSNILGSFSLINGHPVQNNSQITTNQSSSASTPVYTVTNSNNTATNSQQTAQYSGTTSQSATTEKRATSSSVNIKGVRATSLQMGAGVNNSLDIIDGGTNFPVSEKQIHLVFDYQGSTNGQNFEVKWLSVTHNCLVIADEYLPVVNGKNRVHSYIDNTGNAWPLGDYRAEIWYSGQKLAEKEFSIGKQQVGQTSTPGNILGKCYADGKGNNQTKSLGGKYYSLDLNTVNDNDVFEVRVTSGTLQFVMIHYRNSSGIWYLAYKGPNTKFRIGDILNGKRNLYTHLIINVNAEHEKYLPLACYADIILNPSGQNPPAIQQQTQNAMVNTPKTNTGSGKIYQIVMDNNNCGFDFATGHVRSCHQSPDPDVMSEPWCTNNPALCGNWAKTGKSRLEDVTSAPASGYISDGKSFTDCQECPVNEVLVFKLKDGSYGKLLIVKDDYGKVNGNCQHKITCMIEYPAFK